MIESWKSKAILKETTSTVIIRFQDCDPFRHLNNSKYFDYFFNAREDQIAKHYDFRPVDIFKKYNSGWVAYNHHIAYLRPAMVSEWVKIFSRIIGFTSDTLVTEYYMSNQDKTELKTVFLSTVKYVDGFTGKKIAHQEDLLEFLQAIAHENLSLENIRLDSRIAFIKKELEQTNLKTKL